MSAAMENKTANGFVLVPGFDYHFGAGPVRMDLRPVAMGPRGEGASVEFWTILPRFDEDLLPPPGWHWFGTGRHADFRCRVSFEPSFSELLDAAVRILNSRIGPYEYYSPELVKRWLWADSEAGIEAYALGCTEVIPDLISECHL